MIIKQSRFSSGDSQGKLIFIKEVKMNKESQNFEGKEKGALMKTILIVICKNIGRIKMNKHVSYIGTRLIPTFHKLLIILY